MLTRSMIQAPFILSLLASCRFVQAVPPDDTSVSAAASTVNLGYATYQGSTSVDPITSRTNTEFIGIRYAAPPVGSLRFVAPQKPPTVDGVQNADTQPDACYQSDSGVQPKSPFRQGGIGDPLYHSQAGGIATLSTRQSQDVPVSEDCLFLNVYVPGNVDSTKKLPVIVFIHGGGYISGDISLFDGSDLIRASNGSSVVVLPQYRLGLLGFLAGKAVKEGGALNAGLLDQQFALQWVHDNINNFGGDPLKVTIWGESAGAGSVLQHVVANGGKTNPSLFRAAILSSTFLPSQYKYDDRIPEALYSQAVSITGCSSSRDTLQCLRSADVTALDSANTEIIQSGFYGTFTFVPVVDGSLITDRPTVLLKQGKINGNALLAVTNIAEGPPFVNGTLPVASPSTSANYAANLFPILEIADANRAAQLYTSFNTISEQAGQIMSDTIFLCPTYYALRAFEKKVTYKGEFAIPPGNHGQDAVYYFPSISDLIPPTFNNTQFITAFSEAFANFWLSLDPNKKWDSTNITPTWKTWSSTNTTEMMFGKTASNKTDIKPFKTSDALLKRCDFWESVSGGTAQ